MKLFFIALSLSVLPLLSQAQQEPQFTHFTWNRFVFNPAVAGSRDAVCITGLYHNQWASFSGLDEEGAPVTKTLSVHAPIKQKFGAGIHILDDKEGFIGTRAAYGSGAYHFSLSPDVKLGVGLSAGLVQKSIDAKWHPLDNEDFPSGPSSIGFDAALGIYAQSDNWYAGISSLHVTQSHLTWESTSGSISYSLRRSYWLTGAYNWQDLLDGKMELTPAVLLKTDFSKIQYGINLRATYNKIFFAGMNFRNETLTAFSTMAGVYIKKKLAVGYSIDIPTGKNASVFGATHEVMLQFCPKMGI